MRSSIRRIRRKKKKIPLQKFSKKRRNPDWKKKRSKDQKSDEIKSRIHEENHKYLGERSQRRKENF